MFVLFKEGYIGNVQISSNVDMVPSIVLKKDIKLIDGNGTKENAYKIDENPFDSGTLAYEIVKNAQNVRDNKEIVAANSDTNTTKLSPVPETIPAQEISKEDERTLSITEDTLGQSYYYRGNIQDNYLNFNNMCWRIVRIEGDGSIKLVLEDKTQTCETATGGSNASIGQGNYGYTGNGLEMDPYRFDYENNIQGKIAKQIGAKELIQTWINSFNETDKLRIKTENWCLGNKEDWYDYSTGKPSTDYNAGTFSNGYSRIYGKGQDANPTLKCDNSNDKSILELGGLLTADELAYAGSKWYIKESGVNFSHYLKNTNLYWWLSTPALRNKKEDIAFAVRQDGDLYGSSVNSIYPSIRPSIVLKSNIEYISGNGTQENPYQI